LADSARVLGFRELPWTEDQIASAIKEVCGRTNWNRAISAAHLLRRTPGTLIWMPGGRRSESLPGVEYYLGEEALAKGIRANVSSFTRHHPNVMMTKAKIAGNYATASWRDRIIPAWFR